MSLRSANCLTRFRTPLSLLAASLALVLLPSCGIHPQPDVLLITIDTLRVDHLGAYGAERTGTPNLDRFTRDATVFHRAASPLPLTRPSHASIFTSLYPREHGVLNNRTALPESRLTLAEILAGIGYRTAAFVAVRLLSPESGMAQGFGVLDFPSEDRQRGAQDVVPPALAWLRGLQEDERFFLWVHLFDPHQPYGAPSSFRPELDPELEASLPSVAWPELLDIAEENDGDIPAAVLDHAKSLYRGDVQYADYWFGRLLDGLAASRDLDETMIVLTADHGECFENGVFFEHADCLLEGAIRIPLIVRYPRDFAPASRISSQVSNIDVAPTVLLAAGIQIPPDFSGRALQRAADSPDRYVLVQYPFYQPMQANHRLKSREVVKTVAGIPVSRMLVDAEKVGVVGRDWKYLRTVRGEERTEELHRMSPVPNERENLWDAADVPRERIRAILDAELEAHPLNLVAPEQINEELLETLQALGYAE